MKNSFMKYILGKLLFQTLQVSIKTRNETLFHCTFQDRDLKYDTPNLYGTLKDNE